MKKASILLLLGALGLPAAPAAADPPVAAKPPAAEASAPAAAPVIGTKWSLKAKPKPGVQGPQVPAPQRIRTPRAAPQVVRRQAKQRPNNQPLVNAIAKAKRNHN
ncbi:hypothetical protein [Sphingosinicella rhizophila]|uniref:Uncharacterized protein n=1 Tax=Sphingosinicella rhizophila TaxID=3050082 RepID=A0ABU3QBH7_9SPHN|nr:hypothetical protein [Sphingosinicella sp. GR2756]MDT9600755.1 hypothetical protein [Sphingosinicella sp. GR2756]